MSLHRAVSISLKGEGPRHAPLAEMLSHLETSTPVAAIHIQRVDLARNISDILKLVADMCLHWQVSVNSEGEWQFCTSLLVGSLRLARH